MPTYLAYRKLSQQRQRACREEYHLLSKFEGMRIGRSASVSVADWIATNGVIMQAHLSSTHARSYQRMHVQVHACMHACICLPAHTTAHILHPLPSRHAYSHRCMNVAFSHGRMPARMLIPSHALSHSVYHVCTPANSHIRTHAPSHVSMHKWTLVCVHA